MYLVGDSENVNVEGIFTLNVNINLYVEFCTKMPTIREVYRNLGQETAPSLESNMRFLITQGISCLAILMSNK